MTKYTEIDVQRVEADRILRTAKERAELKFTSITQANQIELQIKELELMLCEKEFKNDSETIFIEMQSLTDKFLSLTK